MQALQLVQFHQDYQRHLLNILTNEQLNVHYGRWPHYQVLMPCVRSAWDPRAFGSSFQSIHLTLNYHLVTMWGKSERVVQTSTIVWLPMLHNLFTRSHTVHRQHTPIASRNCHSLLLVLQADLCWTHAHNGWIAPTLFICMVDVKSLHLQQTCVFSLSIVLRHVLL